MHQINLQLELGFAFIDSAQNFGINFTPEEAEAMTVNDRDLSDNQARWHSSLLASIVRQASEMTYLQDINSKKA